ncbi:MAG: holo-ACP synthase [Proteobacteria bacterium]|nr:holo-ACP synthase [Pseudomonadota bacterium]
MIVGSGVDVIEIARIERALSERGARFAGRVFTPAEIEACEGPGRSAPRFALRFAAKEAAMKAIGTGWSAGVRWRDIEAMPGANGPGEWVLRLSGRAHELAGARGTERAWLSVSRSRTHALALVVLEGGEP